MQRLSAPDNPIQAFLQDCHERYRTDFRGALADYIPQLATADPAAFGICLCTADGHLYEVGDTQAGFTIQSISKALVYGMALQDSGIEAVKRRVGVEPSGDAFNSISLRPEDGRPFNPMINAGAIACTGLVRHTSVEDGFRHIMDTFSAYAARPLGFDADVYASEAATGDRNRAIAFMLKTHGILAGDVVSTLDLYFRQCSIEVTARDLAVAAATLANKGVNPVSHRQVLDDELVQNVLSVMATCGMYDFAGEWIYDVGMPAKSGVGGGILAVLPGQLGVGVYSPLLDARGNSVRGVEVCRALSAFLGLHLFKAEPNFAAVLHARYDVARVASRRQRPPTDRRVLDAHGAEVDVLELKGYLTFSSMEFITRQVYERLDATACFIFDFRRVAYADAASMRLLGGLVDGLLAAGRRIALAGLPGEAVTTLHLETLLADSSRAEVCRFGDLDTALEWAEDDLLRRYRPAVDAGPAVVSLADNELCAGLDPDQITRLAAHVRPASYACGATIIRRGERSDRLYFLSQGQVSVRVGPGLRITTLSAGMAFGEFALIEGSTRSADVVADTDVECWELCIDDVPDTEQTGRDIRFAFSKNLTRLLAGRLRGANNTINTLSAA